MPALVHMFITLVVVIAILGVVWQFAVQFFHVQRAHATARDCRTADDDDAICERACIP